MTRSFFPLLVSALLSLGASSCKKAEAMPDYGKIPTFSLLDQQGKPFTDRSLAGEPYAAAFVFTRCPMACPKVTVAMRGVQADAARRSVSLHLVSFSIDPENDTPEVLRKYAQDYGADLETWTFVTGDADSIRTTAERGFKVAVDGKADPSKADFGITHGTQLVLVDGIGTIRGFYGSGEPEALKQLVTDAGRLASP